MNLGEWAAAQKRRLLQDLESGLPPSSGEFDEATWKEGRAKGRPQLGATVFKPESATFEFLFPDPGGSPVVLSVTLRPPERIVYLPVPGWVVESVWQGEVDGSYHFESEALTKVAELLALLEAEPNAKLFQGRLPTGRS